MSLSENDFNKAFEREPILFDVMLNSIAIDNPLVTVTHDSDILQPKGKVYSFVGEDGDNAATLVCAYPEALYLMELKYTATTGDGTGLRFSVSGSVTSANVYYGENF